MAFIGLGMDDERLAGVVDARQPVVELGRAGPLREAVEPRRIELQRRNFIRHRAPRAQAC